MALCSTETSVRLDGMKNCIVGDGGGVRVEVVLPVPLELFFFGCTDPERVEDVELAVCLDLICWYLWFNRRQNHV